MARPFGICPPGSAASLAAPPVAPDPPRRGPRPDAGVAPAPPAHREAPDRFSMSTLSSPLPALVGLAVDDLDLARASARPLATLRQHVARGGDPDAILAAVAELRGQLQAKLHEAEGAPELRAPYGVALPDGPEAARAQIVALGALQKRLRAARDTLDAQRAAAVASFEARSSRPPARSFAPARRRSR